MLFFFQIFSLCCLLVVFTSPTHTYNDLMTETHITDIEFEDSFDLYIQTNTGLSYLTYLLTHSDLYGKWYNQEKPKGHFLQSQSGFSHMFPLKNDTTLKMCLYSGVVKHSESSCLKILNTTTLLQDSIFDYETMTITLPDIAVHIEEYRGDETIERDCLVDYTFKFASRKGDDLFDPSYDLDIDKENLAILFQIHNSNCSIDLASRLLFPRYTSLSLANVLDYLIDIILIGFTVQLLASRWVSENLLKASKQISLGKLLMIQAFDFYVAFQYWLGETSKLKPAKSIPAPSIMMILAFMASMIHAVAQRQKRLDQPAYCHVRWLNYSLWVIIPGGALTASLVWKEHRAILLVGCLYEIPQIIQNFLTQTKYSFDFSIFFFLVLPKAIYIGWILAFADIILGFNCDKEINLFCCLIILEIAVVIIQTQRPKLWIKIKSPYKMRSHCKIEDMEEVCAICLEANLPVINESHYWCFGKNLNDAEMIVTPCNHQFHQRYLKIWMKRNLSCPYCRCDLPSLP